MGTAVLTLEGFNEVDSFVASARPNRAKQPELTALVVSPSETVTSTNGLTVQSQAPLSFARDTGISISSSMRSRANWDSIAT